MHCEDPLPVGNLKTLHASSQSLFLITSFHSNRALGYVPGQTMHYESYRKLEISCIETLQSISGTPTTFACARISQWAVSSIPVLQFGTKIHTKEIVLRAL